MANAAVLLPRVSNSALIRNLAKDLGEVAAGGRGPDKRKGAAAAMFGRTLPETVTECVDPGPTVGQSSVQQDRAVHSAMTNPLTVVTGPPGSGKSQVVLNTVAAAVCRGETVLIASKNNKAVDVVVERLRATAPLCPVVRAGAASQRQALAGEIDRLVGEAERSEPAQGLVDANDAWVRVRARVRAVHRAREERLSALEEVQALEARLADKALAEDVPDVLDGKVIDNAAERARAALRGLDVPREFKALHDLEERVRRDGPLPEGLPYGIAAADVEAVAEDVEGAFAALSRGLGLFGRRRRRELRVAAVRDALESFGECVPHFGERALRSIAQVDAEQPEAGVGAARERFGSVVRKALAAVEKATTRRRRDEARAEIDQRLARMEDALAAFGDCAPHLRERAAACLDEVDPLAVEPGVHKAGAMLQAVLAQAQDDAAGVADRVRRQELASRLEALPDGHDSEDGLWELSQERTKAGLGLFRARIRQMQNDRPKGWQAAGRLASRIGAVARGNARVSEMQKLVPDALRAVPVWAITNLSVRGTLPLVEGLFDLVVIDEASQCDAASALPLLVRGKRAMVIGDEHQLQHITALGEQREGAIAERCGLGADDLAAFGYRANSCFAVARSRLPHPPIMLDLHFRSHPAVVEFSNRRFYAGRMTMCGTARPPAGMSAIEWVEAAGRCERGAGSRSWQNRLEAKSVAARVAGDLKIYRRENLSVGVVTPFAGQAKLILSTLREEGIDVQGERIEVATAHRFQGGERDVIYFSPVIDDGASRQLADFAGDPNLLNVALTRARCRVVIVGAKAACERHPNQLQALATHVADLGETAFDSPLERDLHAALRERGVDAEPGVEVGRYRLDLAIRRGDGGVDVECDGAPFHTDDERDAERDRVLRRKGWTVVRFSGRRIEHRVHECVDEVLGQLTDSRSSRKGNGVTQG